MSWKSSNGFTAALTADDYVYAFRRIFDPRTMSPYTELFSPARSILRPALFSNAVQSVVALLTPTAPRCPHLGCALHWNAEERSWDCPCHGSRFAKDGTLLDNPATGDLKSVQK